jgi:transcriptional regulator with XRE-family HTH domain
MQHIFISLPYDTAMNKNSQARGEQLRLLREAAGLSQRELGDRLHIHHSNIGYWERSGNLPRSEILSPMAKVLGVNVDNLLGERVRASRVTKPTGRARMAFQAVSRLPKRQQMKIVEVVEAFVAQHAVNQ